MLEQFHTLTGTNVEPQFVDPHCFASVIFLASFSDCQTNLIFWNEKSVM
jgi:hypothetical protein